MPLKTKVKVGNITNLSDARYCAGMGVDLLGFPIGIGAGKISSDQFLEIAEWVAGPEFVFDYSEPMDVEEFKKVTKIPSIRYIQLTIPQYESFKSLITNKAVILTTELSEVKGRVLDNEMISYLIISNSQNSVSNETLNELNTNVPILIRPDQSKSISDLINNEHVSGIVLEGTSEERPGHKNYDHLSEVLESLEIN